MVIREGDEDVSDRRVGVAIGGGIGGRPDVGNGRGTAPLEAQALVKTARATTAYRGDQFCTS